MTERVVFVCPSCSKVARLEPRRFPVWCCGMLHSLSANPVTVTSVKVREKKPARLPCAYLGNELERVECPSCCGNVLVKVFACAIHGDCTAQKDVGKAVCGTCKEYRSTIDPDATKFDLPLLPSQGQRPVGEER